MLAARLRSRNRDSRLFKRYVKAADRYLKWVFVPSFLGSIVVMLIGAKIGTVPFGSQGAEMLSTVIFLSIASWFGANGLGLAWGVAIDLKDDASRESLADVALLALLALVAGVFLYGAFVFGRAAVAAWAKAL